jgi:hypothetical protein
MAVVTAFGRFAALWGSSYVPPFKPALASGGSKP